MVGEGFQPENPYGNCAIPRVVIILLLLLQKPFQKSKSSDHIRNLNKRRMKMWKEGKVRGEGTEGTEIQKRLKFSRRKEEAVQDLQD